MTAIQRVETSVEPAAIAYPLRSPVLDVLRAEDARAQIVPLLPKGVDYETVMIEVYRAATKDANILKCEPKSIIRAVGDAVRSGLLIGKTIHLVPIAGKLDAWTDYKGDIELVVRAGAARHVDGQAIYERDAFEYELGDRPFVRHKPALRARGALIGAYAIAHLTNTLRKIAVMSIEDIEAIRAKSQQWNPNKMRACPEWYAIKSAVHRVCKTLPKNERLAAVMALFDRQAENDRIETAIDISDMTEVPESAPLAAKFEDAGASSEPAPVRRSAAWRFALPFGSADSGLKGRPIGELSAENLQDARDYARGKGDTYQAFLDASDELMDERRLDAGQ